MAPKNYLVRASTGNYTRIRCKSCAIVKNREAFSDKQLSVLDQHIQSSRVKIDPTTAKIVYCNQCSGETRVRVELKCAECKHTKSIDEFNKTQRRKGDEAMCERCQKIELGWVPPADRDADRDNSRKGNQYDSDSDSDDTDVAYSDEEESFAGVSVSDTHSSSARTNRSKTTAFSGHDAGSVASRSIAASSITGTSSYASSNADSSTSTARRQVITNARDASPAYTASNASTAGANTRNVAPHRTGQSNTPSAAPRQQQTAMPRADDPPVELDSDDYSDDDDDNFVDNYNRGMLARRAFQEWE